MERSNEENKSLKLVSDLLATKGYKSKATPPSCKYDLASTRDDGRLLHVEVKQRRLNVMKFISYSVNGFMMERKKYDFLLGKHSLYVNVFDFDNLIVITNWNINTLEKKDLLAFDLLAPSTTDFTNNQTVSKPSIFLTLKQCSSIYIQYKKDNLTHHNKWIQVTHKELLNKLTTQN